jgi:GTPase SAR1 family protein
MTRSKKKKKKRMESLLNGLRSLFSNILFKLGLTTKNATILLVGLDNAGKTTLLYQKIFSTSKKKKKKLIINHFLSYKLKNGAVKTFTPTQRANIEEIAVGNLRLKAVI